MRFRTPADSGGFPEPALFISNSVARRGCPRFDLVADPAALPEQQAGALGILGGARLVDLAADADVELDQVVEGHRGVQGRGLHRACSKGCGSGPRRSARLESNGVKWLHWNQ